VRRFLLIIAGLFAVSVCFSEIKDFVPEELKSFVKDGKGSKRLINESKYYHALSIKVSVIRDKYPKELTPSEYINYLNDLNDLLIERQKNHRRIEDFLLDEVNYLRQKWMDSLQRAALREVSDNEEVWNAE
jgi:CRISPR-associated protein Cas8b1/Cst1 subtype I-B